ncbi:hypothetical protein ACOMHN_038626 [Nucella lapillus]
MSKKYNFNTEMEEMKEKKEKFSASFVYMMTFGITLGAVCFGYNLAAISGAMLYVQPDFDLDTTWQSVMVGAAVISATVSSLTAGYFTDTLGRRMTLLVTAVLCVTGPVISAAAPNKEVLLAGRMVTGLTFPFLAAFCLMHIAEMSPTCVRGRLLAFNQQQVNFGVLLSALMAGAFSYAPSNQWRYMLGFAAVPALFFGLAVYYLPESPRWLIAKGRQSEAATVLQRIYGCDDVKHHLQYIKESLNDVQEPTDNVCSTVSRMARTRHVLKALAVGCCLAFFFAWSGINAVLSYCGTIMKTVGFPVEHAVWVQGMAALASCLSTLPVLWAVERKNVSLTMAGCAVTLALVSVGFHLTAADFPDVQPLNVTNGSLPHLARCRGYINCEACVVDTDCGLCYQGTATGYCVPALNERYSTVGPCSVDNQKKDGAAFTFALDYCPSVYAWIVVAGIFLFCFFSQGIAALAFTVNAEIYPMWARSLCTSLVAGLFWVFNIVISFSFLYIVEAFNTYGTFWLFAAMCAIGFVLLTIFLPETKNRSLEEVEQLFMTSQELQRHRQQREGNQPEDDGKLQETPNL